MVNKFVALFLDAPGGVTNIFKPDSIPARYIAEYSLLVLVICGAIFAVVAAILTYTIIRFRQRSNDDSQEPPQIYGSNQIELAWTVLPILIVLVFVLVTARTTVDLQDAKPPASALQVTVVGHQWWWEMRYPKLGIVTANELHVPLSDHNRRNPTFIKLQSADVAHSFWVPQLAGKTDLIPNRDNSMWIEPTKTGTYLGNCAEYCGTQHAHMLIRVIVESEEDFQKWVESQQALSADNSQVETGRDLFFSTNCINCHSISGTSAAGKFGPDLTHLMSRETLGSGVVANNPERLRAWVKDPQKLKAGCFMPNMQLTDAELDKIVPYLLTLK